jgi:hypothetical protein
MKKLSLYDKLEWCRLEPFRALVKELRNDLLLGYFLRLKAKGEKKFLLDNKHFENKNVLIVIAFEQPKVLSWLFSLSKINLSDFNLMVFDNSKNLNVRKQIEDLCQQHKIPYLSLPNLNVKHPNRSHGLAMTWVFHRVIKVIKPNYFGFLDHDMYPVKKISLLSSIPKTQNFYGSINKATNYWGLWAGYCFFKFKVYGKRPLNFLYDFSRGLDTGGRNWSHIYEHENMQLSKFAPLTEPSLQFQGFLSAKVQLIDDAWIHVGGVSYKDSISTKENFHSKIVEELLAGRDIDQFKVE